MSKKPTVKMTPVYPDREDTSHPWANSLNRFAVDTLLRKAGYQIATRPKTGPTIWSRQGKSFTERQALKTLSATDVNNARCEQDSYLDIHCEGVG